MFVEVEMNAFQNGKIRKVQVDDQLLAPNDLHQNLEKVFYFGQNDFQPVEGCCSVSMGDVIRYQGKRYEVAMFGFEEVA
jgi:hypothetical protein